MSAQPVDYLPPIVSDPSRYGRDPYRNTLAKVNAGLSEISGILNIYPPITTFAARPSQANVAYARKVPERVISAALGHDSECTTRICLDPVSWIRVDRANATIIRLLREKDK